MTDRKTVLLVEDEFLLALTVTKALEREGYRVIHAGSGEKAIAAMEGPEPIDIVLMDINLGEGIDGTEAATEILRRHDLPLLFLSSHTERAVVEKTEAITNYGYVVKNSSITVLDASMKMAFKLFEARRGLDRLNMDLAATNEELQASLDSLQESEALLARSEEKFSKAFHLSPDSVNINRLADGVYLDINTGFTTILGYTREDTIGHSSLPGGLGIWVDPEDRRRLVEGLGARGEVSNLEAEFRRKDGSTTIGWMSAKIIEIEGEKCILSITRDMGDWKRLERELVEADLKFRAAFELAPMAIAAADLDGRLRMANPALCRLLGRSEEELRGADFQSFTHPDDVEENHRWNRELLDGRIEVARYRKRYLHKDGSVIDAEIATSLIRGEGGRPLFFIAYVEDAA